MQTTTEAVYCRRTDEFLVSPYCISDVA